MPALGESLDLPGIGILNLGPLGERRGTKLVAVNAAEFGLRSLHGHTPAIQNP